MIRIRRNRVHTLCMAFLLVSISLFPALLKADNEEMTILRNKVTELEKRDIENRVIIQDLKELIAQLNMRLDNLEQKVGEQESVISTVPKRVPRPVTTSPETSGNLSGSVSVEEIPIENVSGTVPKNTDATQGQQTQPKETPIKQTPPPVTETVTPSDDPKKELYNLASKLYNTASYDRAIAKYKEFIEKYPDDDLTDNAQFWIGESYLKKNEYLKSIEEYQKVIEYYPLGNKVPEAYLKIGYAYINLKDNVSALQYFNLVKDMFPHTDASVEAEKKIRELQIR